MAHHASNPVIDCLFIFAVIVASVIGAAQSRKKATDRSSELRSLSQRLGFAGFDPGRNAGFVIGWEFLSCLSQGEDLVSLRNYIRESWSDVDVELKRRYDLIPNLVATVKGYAAHERNVLEQVTELRNRFAANNGPVASQSSDEIQLVNALKHLLAVAENYPNLKADQQFLKLQDELVNTEDRIQAARRFYNGNVRDYRNKCETFPSNVVARMFGFKPEGDFFSVPPSVRNVPNVDFAN